MTKRTTTSEASHRATRRGYADGALIEPGQTVPAGIPVSSEWMASTDAAEPEASL